MSNGTPKELNATSDPYSRGFQTGCLLGCAPLIFLILLVFGIAIFSIGSSSSDFEDERVAIQLPDISDVAAGDILPKPPPADESPIYLGDDLSGVPLLALEAHEHASSEDWKKRKAHAVASALHMNQQDQDGYLKAALRSRPDLAGLPFTMGNACRTTGDGAVAFNLAADAIQRDKGAALVADKEPFNDNPEVYHHAQMAVATQVIPVQDTVDQQSLIRGLASIPRPEATRRLARLAVFSPDDAVRKGALDALAIRRGEPATEVLVSGLQYPWPAVARNAAAAIVQLKRTDLIPQLEAVLHAPDPRAPKQETVADRQETVAYEVVRVNHLQNCLLCHAPIRRGEETRSLTAEIPVPTMPLPDNSFGYGRTESNLLVRLDVTYLRQDFSAVLEVSDWSAQSWPARQRFDFLLRRRVLSPTQAAELHKRLEGVSPYQRAAADALRALTGKDVDLRSASSHPSGRSTSSAN